MIKLVAVDMDGTFLSSEKEYDRQRFQHIYESMQKNNIAFVVASGNQYYQLKTFFPQAEELMYVAENGAYVKDPEEELFVGNIEPQMVKHILDALAEIPEMKIVLCGKNSAYTSHPSQAFYEYANQYYVRLKKVVNFHTLPDDQFFKFALSVDEHHVSETLDKLERVLKGVLVPVSSGHGDIDLIIPNVTKASGLARIGEKYQITAAEMAAFGDSGNDKEMLAYVGHSFAMENAAPIIKDTATHIIPSNNNHGVLETLETIMNTGWQSYEKEN